MEMEEQVWNNATLDDHSEVAEMGRIEAEILRLSSRLHHLRNLQGQDREAAAAAAGPGGGAAQHRAARHRRRRKPYHQFPHGAAAAGSPCPREPDPEVPRAAPQRQASGGGGNGNYSSTGQAVPQQAEHHPPTRAGFQAVRGGPRQAVDQGEQEGGLATASRDKARSRRPQSIARGGAAAFAHLPHPWWQGPFRFRFRRVWVRGSNKKKDKNKKGLKGSPVDKLTDDILTDIISRVPYKSTCCCKCVSSRWRDLFFHPDHRKKLPQPLAGFFHKGYNMNRHPRYAQYFTNVSGKGYPLVNPSLPFLPRYYERIDILDCCNGLLLCHGWKASDPKRVDYVVCNPATQKWTVVPANPWSSKADIACLGFEPTGSSCHFHVFQFTNEEELWGMDESVQFKWDGRFQALSIYSSKAGVWKHHCPDNYMFYIPQNAKGVFLNGILHLPTSYASMSILAVDVEGNDWPLIDIPMPSCNYSALDDAIFVSQRQLYITDKTAGSDSCELSVWALEDYNTRKWTLKHNVSHSELFGAWYSSFAGDFNVISLHPEHNMIFIVGGHENTLMSYDMDRRELCVLCHLGRDCQIPYGRTPYLPYVPLFSEALADG